METKISEVAFPVLETSRLVLRRVTAVDAVDMLGYLSNAVVTGPMGMEPFTAAEEVVDEIAWYERIFDQSSGIRWGITLKGPDRVIGSCGFLNRKTEHHRAEIGYELHPEYWRRGIMKEALKAITTFGYQNLDLERIEALIEPSNSASQRLVERCGFVREGLLRHYEKGAGKFDDLLMYSLLKSDLAKSDLLSCH